MKKNSFIKEYALLLIGFLLLLVSGLMTLGGVIGFIKWWLVPMSLMWKQSTIAASAIGLISGFLVKRFYIILFSVPTYTIEDILTALNLHWKDFSKVADTMQQNKGVGSSTIDYIIRRPVQLWLANTLDSLVTQGFVDERHQDGKYEYRLTEDGEKELDRLRTKSTGFQGLLSPT